jgi:hypothetical protein
MNLFGLCAGNMIIVRIFYWIVVCNICYSNLYVVHIFTLNRKII